MSIAVAPESERGIKQDAFAAEPHWHESQSGGTPPPISIRRDGGSNEPEGNDNEPKSTSLHRIRLGVSALLITASVIAAHVLSAVHSR